MNNATFITNNLWILISTMMVFIMHLGFATIEAGLVQQKNTVNILFKNVIIVCIGLLCYYAVGFNLMYPGADFAGGLFGFAGFGLALPEGVAGLEEYASGKYAYYTDFIFQAMFAATCASIVSGAVAERIKLLPFLAFVLVFVTLCYPITGMWKWGGGWLHKMGFIDFAGSTLVHSVGGWGALAGVMILGPRLGKYTEKGIRPIPGHNMPLATIGAFLLWFGWFGFNGGSVLSADPGAVSLVFVNTCLGAASGALATFIVSYLKFKSLDHSMVLNGILGGLVGITAGADGFTPGVAIIVGLIAGTIVPFSVVFFDKLKLDDPVGATTVHLVCGVWGTLAVGILGNGSFLTQLIGVMAIGAFTFVFAYILFFIIIKVVGLRVDEYMESKGLDVTEHEMSAYQNVERGSFTLMSSDF
jgi:ammonium transporter, Amt family